MAFHFVPGVDRVAPLGSIGVRLFFVLSGFLITRILLDARRHPPAEALKVFYSRRALRIFPVFYLVLAIASMMNIGPVRQTLGWHVSYLTNAYLFLHGDWHGSVSHLWSLAVEEQFYLVWPWLVLMLTERRLAMVIVAMIAVAPISRLLISGAMHSVLPTSCLDSLGAGALLALPFARAQVMRAGLWVGAPLLAASLVMRVADASLPWTPVVIDVGVALAAAWVVGKATAGFGGPVGAFLGARPVIYVGTISYGLYLFHGFMPYVLGRYLPGFVEMSWQMRALLLTVTTTIISILSWHAFERPLLSLKARCARPVDDRDQVTAMAA